MSQYSLNDPLVRRVLGCLSDLHRHDLGEIVFEYNKKYPPSLLLPVPKKPEVIKPVLEFLVREGMVTAEVLTFYVEAIPATKFYALTRAGIQYAHRRR